MSAVVIWQCINNCTCKAVLFAVLKLNHEDILMLKDGIAVHSRSDPKSAMTKVSYSIFQNKPTLEALKV